jgi:hypothetical protein
MTKDQALRLFNIVEVCAKNDPENCLTQKVYDGIRGFIQSCPEAGRTVLEVGGDKVIKDTKFKQVTQCRYADKKKGKA